MEGLRMSDGDSRFEREKTRLSWIGISLLPGCTLPLMLMGSELCCSHESLICSP